MRLIRIDSLKPGDVLSTPIRNADGSLILQANKTITANYIDRLLKMNITAVYIVDDLFDDVIAEPVLDDEQKIKLLEVIDGAFEQIKRKKKFEFNVISDISGVVYENVSMTPSPVNLINMFSIDDPRFFHSLNVGLMVAAMANEAGWDKNRAVEYITAALLHDIMLEDLTKPETIQHADNVLKFLKDQITIPARTYMACYMHHDAFDGSAGHKQKMTGKEINEGARVIAVADFYENAVNGYAGFTQMKPHQALEYLNTQSGTLLDPDIINIFNTTVAIYPTGSTVMLNNGYRAIVTKQNAKTPSRPVVRLLMEKREDCLEYNLLTSRTLFIDKVEL
jgi:HD-GYP domain-containing protein (c-di-GMP phosphodiesterase class II)